MKFEKIQQGVVWGLVLAGVFTWMALSAQALRLSDLVKRVPQLYMPSQVIPGQPATFTLKARPGQHYTVMISPQSSGAALPTGLALRVGLALVTEEGTLPEAGVAEVTLTVPVQAQVYPNQYVEAVVWSQPDYSDAELTQVIESTGVVATENAVRVGQVADPGSTLVLPGTSGMSQMFRSLDTLNQVNNDPRKRQLVDDGQINRTRQIDRNLTNSAPAPN